MKSRLDAIQTAVGDPTFDGMHERVGEATEHFSLYDIELPEPFRHGFPTSWIFAVLGKAKSIRLEEILSEAKSIISDRANKSRIPLLIISTEREVQLGDHMPPNIPDVFYLDVQHNQKGHGLIHPRLSPLVSTIKGQIGTTAPHGLAPYSRDKPALNWRFFGRQKELDLLTHSHENIMVIGARRIGKTSLLREATRLLRLRKKKAVYVDLQSCTSEGQVALRIVQKTSERVYANIMRRQKVLSLEKPLEQALRSICGDGESVLILDELGNVLKNMPVESWRVLGVLREFAQSGKLRLIFSAFHEVFLRQQKEFEGPLVNFASTMRLRAFTNKEVEEFVFGPLEIWGYPIKHEALLERIGFAVGSHPLLLQYLCGRLYRDGFGGQFETILENILERDFLEIFAEPVTDMFQRLSKAAPKYLFLKKCMQADDRNDVLTRVIIDDEWTREVLLDLGYKSTSSIRFNMLEGLEVRGITEPVKFDHTRQRIITPMVYRVLKRSETQLQNLLDRYAEDVQFEAEDWGLRASGGRAT